MVNQNILKMKLSLFYSLLFSLFIFSFTSAQNQIFKVENADDLKKAIDSAKPGSEIILSDGVWKDIQIEFAAEGTKDAPITLKAETPGKVSLEGQSSLKLAGEYLIVENLHFKNGYTPSDAVIEFRIDKKHIANNSRVSNIVIEDYSQPNRSISDLWVIFWGRHNQLDHSYLGGKFNEGPTLRVALDGNENIKNYHQIVNNHFGPRPRKGGPKAETIQIGSSQTSMAPSYVKVADNLFEECNGEVEVISSKSSFNEFSNNIFYKSEGSLVLRHGNYCEIEGNIFIGDGESPYYGGIRVINTGHWITNNYFYNLRGDEFRSPLAIMNGIPKSPLNRYNQVTDVVVAHNTWINNSTPWQLSVGANNDKDDILPPSEIRSARPKRIVIANNLVYNSDFETPLLKAYDKVDGVEFHNNIVNPKIEVENSEDGIIQQELKMEQQGDYVFFPATGQEFLSDVYPGFEFKNIQTDVFNESREENNMVGAFTRSDYNIEDLLSDQKYGAEWFTKEKLKPNKNKISIPKKEAGSLHQKITEAKNGDIIELAGGNYKLNRSLVIDKEITIQSKNERNKAKISFSAGENIPLFELQANAFLKLKNVELEGSGDEMAFATLKDNMSSGYNLEVDNSEISDFKTILKAYKRSFADEISFVNTIFKDASQGILLDAETDDLGDYNAEFLNIDQCVFKDISKDVISYYRGGYDESTIGGNLEITKSEFIDCGDKDDSNILIKNRGIVNVNISNNVFEDNPVEVIAVLWGEMGNTHKNNSIEESGEIIVEKYLKQKLVY